MSHSKLRGSDVVILTSLTRTPTHNPDQKLGEICVNTGTDVLTRAVRTATPSHRHASAIVSDKHRSYMCPHTVPAYVHVVSVAWL